MARKDRLKEVFDYVRENFPIHTQSDFAEKIRYNRTYLSSAMHGNEKNLTDKLFYNICAAYPNVFNLNYLLTGEGSLLQSNNEAVLGRYPAPPGMVSEDVPSESLPLWADTLIRIMSKQIAENEALHSELRRSIAEVSDLKTQLSQLIQFLSK